MKLKTFSILAALCAPLILASCDKSTLTPDPVDDTVTVEGMIIVEDEGGNTIQVISADDPALRADADFGTWAGLGTYPSGQQVTVSFTPKAPWFTYALYDKTANESTGLTNKRDQSAVSRSLTVTRNVTYVAKVRKVGTAVFTPKVTNGTVTSDPAGGSTTIKVSNDKATPIVGKDGSTVATDNATGLAPNSVTVGNKPSWVTVTVGTGGNITVATQPNPQTSRTATAKREGTVTINVDGKPITVSVKQDSFYEVTPDDVQSGDEWIIDGYATKPNAQYAHNYGGNGGAKSIADFHASLGRASVSVKVAKYINGVLAPQSQWKTHTATWTYGAAGVNWITNSAYTYTATQNTTGDKRVGGRATVTLRIQGATKDIHTTRVNFTQIAEGFVVGGEIQ